MSVVNDRKKRWVYSFIVLAVIYILFWWCFPTLSGWRLLRKLQKKMNRRTKTIYFTLSGIKKPSLFYLRLSYSTTLIFPNYVDCAHSTATLHLFLPPFLPLWRSRLPSIKNRWSRLGKKANLSFKKGRWLAFYRPTTLR
jgi:hypothetical protein